LTRNGGPLTAGCPALADRLESLASFGALVLDVDDTLLARGSGDRPGETFEKSRAAAALPVLLAAGVRVVLITGHGWRQLERRLVTPLRAAVEREAAGLPEGSLGRLAVYANRGATRVAWDGSAHRVDRAYAEAHGISAGHRPAIVGALSAAATVSAADREARPDWYRRAFPRFEGWGMPVVDDREGGALVLRPIPSAFHAAGPGLPDPRAELAARVAADLRRAGLGDGYDVEAEGRSSICIYRRGATKAVALRDAIGALAAASGRSAAEVEAALIYVGDEFAPGGNDAVIPREFPACLCYSVGEVTPSGPAPPGVRHAAASFGGRGTAATRNLLDRILQTARDEPR
jgi:hypothetical protein